MEETIRQNSLKAEISKLELENAELKLKTLEIEQSPENPFSLKVCNETFVSLQKELSSQEALNQKLAQKCHKVFTETKNLNKKFTKASKRLKCNEEAKLALEELQNNFKRVLELEEAVHKEIESTKCELYQKPNNSKQIQKLTEIILDLNSKLKSDRKHKEKLKQRIIQKEKELASIEMQKNSSSYVSIKIKKQVEAMYQTLEKKNSKIQSLEYQTNQILNQLNYFSSQIQLSKIGE